MTNPPQGRPIAQLVRQLWKEQEARVVAGIRRYGPNAISTIDLEQWLIAFIDRIEPFYVRYFVNGQERMERKLSHTKKGMPPLSAPRPGFEIPDFDLDAWDESFKVFNPEVSAFVREYAYAFAQSTNQTTSMKLSNAYKKFQENLARGLEEGASLQTLTADVMRVFRDPQRAMMIAATEASRAYHAGQMKQAKESGIVAGKKWLASSDACDLCLALAAKGPIPLDQSFATIGRGPYAVVMYPPAHPHCFCAWTEVLNDEWRVAA